MAADLRLRAASSWRVAYVATAPESCDTMQQPSVSMALRSGGSADLWPDRVGVPASTYLLADIAWVGIVADPTAPSASGRLPLPAIGVRLHGGGTLLLCPTDPPDAWRFMEALFAVRPALRTQLPPQPDATNFSGAYWGGPGGSAAGTASAGTSDAWRASQPLYPPASETVLAGLAHLSLFFAPVVVPLIIWLATGRGAPYASRQAKQALFFHITWITVTLGAALVWFVVLVASASAATRSDGAMFAAPILALLVLWCFVILVAVFVVGFAIFGALQAFRGRPFSYPLLGRL